jgi:2-C-methyl-D-erythritol 4-phosphate cytidylyltransferase/2-C-methyl-D-erythritol 2,4-cyclodiphosphate synthase
LRDITQPRADAVVVAAGASIRMAGVDKLMATLAGRPLLAWTLDAIAVVPDVDRIVVVAAPDRAATISAATWLPDKVAHVVAGGRRRQDSVGAGVAALERMTSVDDRVVLIHDGARPLVSVDLVTEVIDAAMAHGAAVPVLPVSETIKRVDGDTISGTVDRTNLAVAQTPQGIRWGVLRSALKERPFEDAESWTDEGALLEACKIPVHAVPGDASNLKVTLPADLRLAEANLTVGRRSWVGLGQDSHPFGVGYPLWLGGVEFPGVPRLSGHSDGDVVLHAVADALLGAARLGDLGRLFPADDRTPRGMASGKLLAEAVGRLATAGLRPATLDVTITGARPRLGTRLDEIRNRIAVLTGVAAADVSVKASTGNLSGVEGEGRGVSAMAVALVESA